MSEPLKKYHIEAVCDECGGKAGYTYGPATPKQEALFYLASDTDALMRQREEDYEAACHLADSTSKAWQACRRQLAARERAVWLEVAKLLNDEAETILKKWEHDPAVPHTTHEPVDCHDRCDGYCIVQMAFSGLAEKCRQQAKGVKP